MLIGGVCNATTNAIEFLCLDPRRQRAPAVTVSKQNDEVWLDAGLLAAFNLAQADLHGLLVECRLIAHTPAQVNGLEACAVLFTKLAQLREHLRLQSVAVGIGQAPDSFRPLVRGTGEV